MYHVLEEGQEVVVSVMAMGSGNVSLLVEWQPLVELDPFFHFYGELGWEFPLRHPQSRYISSGYWDTAGRGFDVNSGEPNFHIGLDIVRYNGNGGRLSGVIGGEPVYSIHAGEVLISDWSNSAGWWVVIRSDVRSPNSNQFIVSRYLHFRYDPRFYPTNIHEGNFVEQGTRIGFVGTTGQSTGNHLHFDINRGNAYNSGTAVRPHSINPQRFFPQIDFTGAVRDRWHAGGYGEGR